MNKAILAILAILILAAGVGINKYLVSTKPVAKKSALIAKGTTVEVMTIAQSARRISIRARGTVMPSRHVVLATEVGGKVIAVAPNLQPGGKFSKGEIIARVNPVDYRLAVEQQFALVDSAAAQLQVEESRRAVAKREWEMFGSQRKEMANKNLALREPQMRSATTRLKSAKSGLKRARLSVERTLLRAPFDGMVQDRNVDLGQIVGPGAPLLSFVGTRSYWVQISVPLERLDWFSVPGVNTEGPGSKVVVSQRMGDAHIERQGHVLRLLSDVDPAGHMARLLIEVNNPLEPPEQEESSGESSSLPLLLGSYVEVTIEGREARDIIELDRFALRGGDEVYLFTADATLEKRKVDVLWRQQDTVLLRSGLEPGEQVIVSPLAAAVEGMKLRIPETKTSSGPGAAAKTAAPSPSAEAAL